MSNQLLVCMYMDAPFPTNHLFIFMLSFRLTTKTYFLIQLLIYMTIEPPVHFDAFIPANHKDLLFDSVVHLHDHRCTCSSTDLFILILSFRLTGTVYWSASLLLYIHTQVYPSISIYLFSLIFASGKTRTVICQLIYWSTYPQTFQKINRPVYVDGFSSG